MKYFQNFFTLLFCSTICITALQAQGTIEWAETPALHTISNKDWLNKSAIIIEESMQREYTPNQKTKSLDVLYKFHKIVRVNDEKGIEIYNKVKIAFYQDARVQKLKARSISPSGKVINLTKSSFKENRDEEGRDLMMFAFEGVEKGSELEYYYEIPVGTNYFGSYTMQDEFPTAYTAYEIICPKHLKFEPKLYGNIKVVLDSVINDFRYLKVEGKNLDGVEDEDMANTKAEMARLEYKLAYNESNPGVRLFTWNEIAKTIYERYNTFTEKDKKAIRKILEDKDYVKISEVEKKIIWIENHLKKNYFVNENARSEDFDDIPFILKGKVASEGGYKKLFALAMSEAGINYNLGFTTTRSSKAFDYDFDNWENLDNMVMYFPATKKYIAPLATLYRYPLIPASWGENDGLFIKVMKLGDYSNAIPEKRRIDLEPYASSYHNHNIKVAFNPSMDTVLVETSSMLKGHNAMPFLPQFVFGEKDKLEDFAKETLKMMEKDDHITDVKWENATLEDISSSKPLTISGKIASTSILEKAGNKFLLKIGYVIGRQSELYDDKERKYDIDMNEPHQLLREIVFTIPAGYKVNNLNDIKINKTAQIDGKEVSCFISDYKVEGNKVIINIREDYRQATFPKSIYQSIRGVINAAADFNKVTLVLEKG